MLFLLGLLIFIKETIKPTKPLIVALLIWFSYFIINTILIGSFHPLFMMTYVIKIFIAYWLIGHYKGRIFDKYESVLFVLTVISLSFYLVQIIIPNEFYTLINAIDLSQNLFPERVYASIGVYTFHQLSFSEVLPRNSGFTWEPGPFSCYVVLAMFFLLIRNGKKLKQKSHLIIYFIALLTTKSTTGMLAFLVVMVWYAWISSNKKYVKVTSVIVSLALAVYFFTSVPYLQNKINSESEQDIDEILEYSKTYKTSYAPGRFASFQLGIRDFMRYPIAGIGGNTNLLYANQYGVEVYTINGFANIMVRYGSIGTLLFLALLIASGKWMSFQYNISGRFIFPVLILIFSFSFGIIETPIIAIFWLIPVFMNFKTLRIIKNMTLQNSLRNNTDKNGSKYQ